MKRLALLATPVLLFVALVLPILAPVPAAADTPRFVLGFKLLADQIPDIVGTPLEDEHFNPDNGDSLQQTTKGLMVWRKYDNWTAFTNGYETWINGPEGVQSRLNGQLLPWETPAPTPSPTPTPMPATATPLPTATPVPTATPQPTATPVPVVQPVYVPPTATPVPPAPNATPVQQIGTVTINGIQYLTNLTWAQQGFTDPLLRGALAYAYNYNAEWRKEADMACWLQTKVVWGDLPANVWGSFNTQTQTITISNALRSEFSGSVAAVLAHETYHAALGTSPDPRYCLQTEINAMSWQAATWADVPHPYAPSTTLEIVDDGLVIEWRNGTLANAVLTTPGYQAECLGGQLSSP